MLGFSCKCWTWYVPVIRHSIVTMCVPFIEDVGAASMSQHQCVPCRKLQRNVTPPFSLCSKGLTTALNMRDKLCCHKDRVLHAHIDHITAYTAVSNTGMAAALLCESYQATATSIVIARPAPRQAHC